MTNFLRLLVFLIGTVLASVGHADPSTDPLYDCYEQVGETAMFKLDDGFAKSYVIPGSGNQDGFQVVSAKGIYHCDLPASKIGNRPLYRPCVVEAPSGFTKIFHLKLHIPNQDTMKVAYDQAHDSNDVEMVNSGSDLDSEDQSAPACDANCKADSNPDKTALTKYLKDSISQQHDTFRLNYTSRRIDPSVECNQGNRELGAVVNGIGKVLTMGAMPGPVYETQDECEKRVAKTNKASDSQNAKRLADYGRALRACQKAPEDIAAAANLEIAKFDADPAAKGASAPASTSTAGNSNFSTSAGR